MQNHRMYLALGKDFIAIDAPGDTPRDAAEALNPFLKDKVVISPDTTPVAKLRAMVADNALMEAREAYEASLEAFMKARLNKEDVDRDITTAQIWEDNAVPAADTEGDPAGEPTFAERVAGELAKRAEKYPEAEAPYYTGLRESPQEAFGESFEITAEAEVPAGEPDYIAKIILNELPKVEESPKAGAPSTSEPDVTASVAEPLPEAEAEEARAKTPTPKDVAERNGNGNGNHNRHAYSEEELRKSSERSQAKQQQTIKDALMTQTRWTQGEDRTIRQDFENKVPIVITAQKLGRTYFAVSGRRSILGIVNKKMSEGHSNGKQRRKNGKNAIRKVAR